MAVNAWIAGAAPKAGSLRLILLRWLLWIAAALPGVGVAAGSLGDAVANRPEFTRAPDPLPLVGLGRLLAEIPGAAWGVLLAGAIVAWLGNLLLTAGAVEVLGANEGGRPRPVKLRVLRTVFEVGTRSLWVYLRIALLALVLILIGGRLLGWVFEKIADHGELAGWTARGRWWNLPLVQGLLLFGWMNLVGLWAWWSRVIAVVDGRRYVRRMPGLVLRVCWRRPVQAVLLHLVIALFSMTVGAAVLFAWRQSAAGPVGWIVLWLAVPLMHAYVWHWRIRACRLIWTTPDHSDLRDVPDRPWHVFRRLRERLFRRRRAAAVTEAAP